MKRLPRKPLADPMIRGDVVELLHQNDAKAPREAAVHCRHEHRVPLSPFSSSSRVELGFAASTTTERPALARASRVSAVFGRAGRTGIL